MLCPTGCAQVNVFSVDKTSIVARGTVSEDCIAASVKVNIEHILVPAAVVPKHSRRKAKVLALGEVLWPVSSLRTRSEAMEQRCKRALAAHKSGAGDREDGEPDEVCLCVNVCV